MYNILVLGQIHSDALRLLNARQDVTVAVITDPDAEVDQARIEASDALLIRYGKLSEAVIRSADRLRVVSRHGVGVDNLPLEALSQRGIPVTIVGPVSAASVAEHTMAQMLALAKRVRQYDLAIRAGNWAIRDTLLATELVDKHLLLLGFGRIGREVAKRAAAFDMHVSVADPLFTKEEAVRLGVCKIDDWRNILHQTDVLSLHLPLASSTRHIVDAVVLSAMKPNAMIINAARGGLVDERALAEALAGRMAAGGAALDTFETEPLSTNSPLLALPNVLTSPHSAALTREAARRMGMVAAQNVLDGLDGTLDPQLIFNQAHL